MVILSLSTDSSVRYDYKVCTESVRIVYSHSECTGQLPKPVKIYSHNLGFRYTKYTHERPMSSVHMGFHANKIPNFDICVHI